MGKNESMKWEGILRKITDCGRCETPQGSQFVPLTNATREVGTACELKATGERHRTWAGSGRVLSFVPCEHGHVAASTGSRTVLPRFTLGHSPCDNAQSAHAGQLLYRNRGGPSPRTSPSTPQDLKTNKLLRDERESIRSKYY